MADLIKNIIPVNLQRFADEPEQDDPTTTDPAAPEGNDTGKEEKPENTFSQEEREQYETTQKELETKNAEYQKVVYENAALKAGVDVNSIDDVVALAEKRVTDEVDINAAMKAVVEQYPQFSSQPENNDQPKPHFISGNHNTAGNKPVDPFEAKLEKWR